MTKATVMIVEDIFIVAQDIAVSLKKLGYEICAIASSGDEALEAAKEFRPDLILMDIRLQGTLDGIDTASQIKNILDVAIVYLTAHSDPDTLERASATEPHGYLLKPYDDRQLLTTVELALNRKRAQYRKHSSSFVKPQKSEDETQVKQRRKEFANIIGSHPSILRLLKEVELVAVTDVSVHIYGENGTGKELVAEALHQLSSRSKKPFIKLNCSAIPTTLLESTLFGHAKGAFTGAHKEQEGFIERAEGGTLFLDEVGDVSLDLQVKLLRILQSREYSRVGETAIRKADIRVVTATNRNLKELVAQGKIREDFYYRINVFPLVVPPLREREEDVLAIADHFRVLFNGLFSKNITSLSEEVSGRFLNYPWPGNVRELENVLKRAFVLSQGETIEKEHLSAELFLAKESAGENKDPSGVGIVDTAISKDEAEERQKIFDALQKAGGNKGQAAQILGFSRVTLWKKLSKLGISESAYART